MKIPTRFLVFSLLLGAPLTVVAAVLLEDTFSSSQHPQRQIPTTRGHWKLEQGIATSAHDEELYKKNKNHGAVIWYDVGFRDAVLRFSFRADGCETVGFTLNNPKGHVFRWRQNAGGLAVLAWASQAKDVKATPLHGADKGPKLAHGAWTDVELRFQGSMVTLVIGEHRRTYEHAGLAVEKSRFGISYDKGTFSVRNVKLETLEAGR